MTDMNRKTLVLLIGLAVASRVLMSLVTGYTADDAFITYRYAENLAAGRGFAYNPGEIVQGTSTPLFTIILAGFSRVLGAESLPWVAHGIGVVADAVTLGMIILVTGSLGASSRFLSASLFALFPRLVFCSSLGMETPLVVMLMMLSYVLYINGRIIAACGGLGLLFLLRIDTSLWIAMMVWMILRKEGRILPAGFLTLIVPVAAWLLYAQLTFGSLLPHDVVAKSVSWHHLFGAFDPQRVLLSYLPFHGLHDFPELLKLLICALLVLPVVVILPDLYRRRDPLIVFPVFFLVYDCMFSFARVVMADWYCPPGWCAYVVSLGIFWSWLISTKAARSAVDRSDRYLRYALIPLMVLLLALGIFRWQKDPGEWFQKELVRIGSWLARNAPANSSVMLEPIGEIGWASHLYVHDEVGLVSPRILEYRERFNGSDAWFLRYVEDLRPTYIVLQSHEIPNNILFLGHGDGIFRNDKERIWFFAHYREFPEERTRRDDGHPHFVIYESFDEDRF
jgi:arabinofuranosyltransferase